MGVSGTVEQAGRAGTVQLSRREGQGESYLCISIFDRRMQRRQRQTLLSGAHSEGNGHKVANRKCHFNMKNLPTVTMVTPRTRCSETLLPWRYLTSV